MLPDIGIVLTSTELCRDTKIISVCSLSLGKPSKNQRSTNQVHEHEMSKTEIAGVLPATSHAFTFPKCKTATVVASQAFLFNTDDQFSLFSFLATKPGETDTPNENISHV